MRFGVKLMIFKEMKALLSPFNSCMYYFTVLEYSENDNLCRCSVGTDLESADKEAGESR